MSALIMFLAYGVGIGGMACAGGFVIHQLLVTAAHHNEDALLEVHRLGGTGKIALGEELAKFGWEPEASGYVSQISGRRARLEFASGTWTLEVEGRGGEDASGDELCIEWGFHEGIESHGWPRR